MTTFTELPSRSSQNVILAYDSISAALWASENLTDLLRKKHGDPAVNLSSWNFGVLSNPAWSDLATADTLNADIIVLSTTSKIMQVLPPAVEHWLGKCLSRQHNGTRLSVVAFFRCGDNLDGVDSPRLQKVKQLVQKAGGFFFAPAITEEIPCAV